MLRPFLDLNILRRDWAKGTRDKKTGILDGQGEYFFLTKDIYLVRKPPSKIIENMKEKGEYGQLYLEKVRNYYATYDPFTTYRDDGPLLGKFLLNPDVYDLISLLSNQSYMKDKMPKILSTFSKPEELIQSLLDANVLTIVTKAIISFVFPLNHSIIMFLRIKLVVVVS